jgi:hypothetical protein
MKSHGADDCSSVRVPPPTHDFGGADAPRVAPTAGNGKTPESLEMDFVKGTATILLEAPGLTLKVRAARQNVAVCWAHLPFTLRR